MARLLRHAQALAGLLAATSAGLALCGPARAGARAVTFAREAGADVDETLVRATGREPRPALTNWMPFRPR